MNEILAYALIGANILALVAALMCAFRRKERAASIAAIAMVISILPLVGGMFFPSVVQNVATGETLRTWFFYASRIFTLLYFLMLAVAFILFGAKATCKN